MKRTKRFMSLWLIGAMLAASLMVPGCAGNQSVSSPAPTVEPTQQNVAAQDQQGDKTVKSTEGTQDREVLAGDQTAAAANDAGVGGPLGKYSEPITIEFVATTNANTEDKLKKLNDFYGNEPSLEENRWTRLFKDELNIQVKYKWIVDDSQFEAKWKMAMASGDLPDVSKVGLIDLNQLAQAGLIQEMSFLCRLCR